MLQTKSFSRSPIVSGSLFCVGGMQTPDGFETNFSYLPASNRLIGLSDNTGMHRKFLWAADNIVEELDVNNSTSLFVTNGLGANEHYYFRHNGNLFPCINDYRGSIIGLLDNSGKCLASVGIGLLPLQIN